MDNQGLFVHYKVIVARGLRADCRQFLVVAVALSHYSGVRMKFFVLYRRSQLEGSDFCRAYLPMTIKFSCNWVWQIWQVWQVCTASSRLLQGLHSGRGPIEL